MSMSNVIEVDMIPDKSKVAWNHQSTVWFPLLNNE